MPNTTETPKVFLSYSWSGPEHEGLVMDLATSLRQNGVDAILDKWDLKEGHDKYAFMESMVTDSQVTKVLVICDSRYQKKADLREGGVGTESQIISQEVYNKVAQEKFIPVVCELDANNEPCLPIFLKSRMYVRLLSPDDFPTALDRLLRQIYDKPLHTKPKLGKAPALVTEEAKGLPVIRGLQGAVAAMSGEKKAIPGQGRVLLRSLREELLGLFTEPHANSEGHEVVYQCIGKSQGLRNEADEYFEALAAYSTDDISALAPALEYLEALAAQFENTGSGTYYNGNRDFFKFFAKESLLLLVASLVRHQRWTFLEHVLTWVFVIGSEQTETKGANYRYFDTYLVSLDDHRNRLLELRRISVAADLFRERCMGGATSFSELMQADVILCLDSLLNGEPRERGWTPRCAIFAQRGALPLFVRAANRHIADGILKFLRIESAAELVSRVKALEHRTEDFRTTTLDPMSNFYLPAAIALNAWESNANR